MRFGTRSKAVRATLHCDLQAIVDKALSYGIYDFGLTCGHRTVEQQQQLFAEGKTHIDGISRLGKHNQTPSEAVDFIPSPGEINGINVWSDKQRFAVIAGLLMAAAAELGIKVRWGGDWDGDGNNADSRLHDMPHLELV